jgi:hypothetical protein
MPAAWARADVGAVLAGLPASVLLPPLPGMLTGDGGGRPWHVWAIAGGGEQST